MMLRANRVFRAMVLTCGFLLVAAGLMAAYWWSYKLAPMRHLFDQEWLAAHSEAARWAEEQKDYRRLGSSPDLCFRGDRIGFYGSKEWCLWLVAQIRDSDKFRHCGCTDTALALMTNQRVTSWDEWTEANSARSQEEWIKDGFLEYGVNVHLPPEPEEAEQLVRLLGRQSWDELSEGPHGASGPDAIPGHVQYNAYRWLRDSGFEPLAFASSNAKLTSQSDISRGLLRFAEWHAAYPGDDGLGVLAFGRHSVDGLHIDFRPVIAKPWVRFVVDVFIAMTTIGGGLLVLCFIRRRARANIVTRSVVSDGGPATPAGKSAITGDVPPVT